MGVTAVEYCKAANVNHAGLRWVTCQNPDRQNPDGQNLDNPERQNVDSQNPVCKTTIFTQEMMVKICTFLFCDKHGIYFCQYLADWTVCNDTHYNQSP